MGHEWLLAARTAWHRQQDAGQKKRSPSGKRTRSAAQTPTQTGNRLAGRQNFVPSKNALLSGGKRQTGSEGAPRQGFREM